MQRSNSVYVIGGSTDIVAPQTSFGVILTQDGAMSVHEATVYALAAGSLYRQLCSRSPITNTGTTRMPTPLVMTVVHVQE